MSNTVKIKGAEYALRWDQSTARQIRFRQSAIGETLPSVLRDIRDAAKAEAAMAKLLWMLFPDVSRFPTPESLWLEIEDEDMAEVGKAVIATLSEASPTTEKKSSLKS